MKKIEQYKGVSMKTPRRRDGGVSLGKKKLVPGDRGGEAKESVAHRKKGGRFSRPP